MISDHLVFIKRRALPYLEGFMVAAIIAAVALVAFGFGYWGFSAGIPAWYTAAFGRDGEQLGTVSGWRLPSLWACAGPDIAGAPMLSTVCLNYRNAAALPTGTTLVLRGQVTALGVNVRIVSELVP